jgi:hypothetical protein
MMLKPALAAMLASGLVVPKVPEVIIQGSAVVRPESLAASGRVLPGMPLTMGMLRRREAAAGIQFVGSNAVRFPGSTGSYTSLSLTSLTGGIGTAAIAGDFAVVIFATGSTQNRTGNMAVVSQNASPVSIGSLLYSNDQNDTNMGLFYVRMASTPDTALSIGYTNSSLDAGAAAVLVFRGVSTADPLHRLENATGIDTQRPTPPAVTPAIPGSVIVCAGSSGGNLGNSHVFSASYLSGFTTIGSDDNNDVTVGIGYAMWTGGTFTPAEWAASSDPVTYIGAAWAAKTAVFAPA